MHAVSRVAAFFLLLFEVSRVLELRAVTNSVLADNDDVSFRATGKHVANRIHEVREAAIDFKAASNVGYNLGALGQVKLNVI